MWHIQPIQLTQPVTSWEDDNCIQIWDKVAAFKAKLELWGWWVNILNFDMFQTLVEILKETEPRAFFLPAGSWSPTSAFKRVWVLLPNYKIPKLGRNGSMTYLWISQVNQLCPHYKRINCLKLQMTVALKVCLIQLHISIHSGLKSRWNTLRFPQKYRKACSHFQYPIFVKQGFLQWQQPKCDCRVDWT